MEYESLKYIKKLRELINLGDDINFKARLNFLEMHIKEDLERASQNQSNENGALPIQHVGQIVCPRCGCNKLEHEGDNQYLCLSVLCNFQGQILP